MVKLKAFSVNDTIKHAIKYNLYHRKVINKDNEFQYLGLYKDKSIRAIGEVENIIHAEMENDKLIVKDSQFPPTKDQLNRIIESIINRTDADISKGHKFFCVKNFEDTDFKKVSQRGLQGQKIFNLEDYLDKEYLTSAKDISLNIESKTWE